MADQIYALFEDMETAINAVNDLMTKGISSENISVITHDPEEKYARYIDNEEEDDLDGVEGAGFGAVIGTLTGLGVALIPGFGPVFATGPFAAALIAGVGARTGAFVGGITAALVDFGADEDDVAYYERTLREGGALVIVDMVSATEQELVEEALKAHTPLEMEE